MLTLSYFDGFNSGDDLDRFVKRDARLHDCGECMDFVTQLGRRVNRLLTDRSASQAELARAIGRSQPFISQFLAGKRGIAVELLGDIARFLECEVADLFPAAGDDSRVVPSATEATLIEHYRVAHPQVRQAITAILGVPTADAGAVSPDSFRVAAAYQQANSKDRGIVDAALGIEVEDAEKATSSGTSSGSVPPESPERVTAALGR